MSATDPSFEEQVHTALAANPHLAQRRLQLEAHRGRVVLKGIVSSYFQKQMAQEAVRHVEGVESIENQLEVTW